MNVTGENRTRWNYTLRRRRTRLLPQDGENYFFQVGDNGQLQLQLQLLLLRAFYDNN